MDTEPPELPEFPDDDDDQRASNAADDFDQFGTFQSHPGGYDSSGGVNASADGISSLATPYGGFDDDVTEASQSASALSLPESQSTASFEFTGTCSG